VCVGGGKRVEPVPNLCIDLDLDLDIGVDMNVDI